MKNSAYHVVVSYCRWQSPRQFFFSDVRMFIIYILRYYYYKDLNIAGL